ncbi:MAG TPA: hypothetical protein VGI40_19430 [Pirellulaceae bacterium]|jgi:hypothetical protein
MSNPLLNPNDPRFQRPEILDAAGKNPFADQNSPPDQAPPDQTKQTGDVYAAAAADDAKPFAAQFPIQQTSRAGLLLFLGGIGWGAAAVGALAFTGWFDAGWLSPLLGLGPAGAAWLLAHEELKAIQAGAISAAAQPQARHAFWLGLTGLIACIGIFVAMICWEMRLLPTL